MEKHGFRSSYGFRRTLNIWGNRGRISAALDIYHVLRGHKVPCQPDQQQLKLWHGYNTNTKDYYLQWRDKLDKELDAIL